MTLANGQSLKLSPSHNEDSVSIDKGTGRSPGSDSIWLSFKEVFSSLQKRKQLLSYDMISFWRWKYFVPWPAKLKEKIMLNIICISRCYRCHSCIPEARSPHRHNHNDHQWLFIIDPLLITIFNCKEGTQMQIRIASRWQPSNQATKEPRLRQRKWRGRERFQQPPISSFLQNSSTPSSSSYFIIKNIIIIIIVIIKIVDLHAIIILKVLTTMILLPSKQEVWRGWSGWEIALQRRRKLLRQLPGQSGEKNIRSCYLWTIAKNHPHYQGNLEKKHQLCWVFIYCYV